MLNFYIEEVRTTFQRLIFTMFVIIKHKLLQFARILMAKSSEDIPLSLGTLMERIMQTALERRLSLICPIIISF